MRAFPRILSLPVVAALAAASVGCSSSLEEPNLTAMPTTSDTEPASTTPSGNTDTGTTAPSDFSSSASAETPKPETEEKEPQSGEYSYDRVKNADGYIVNVGLGEAGQKASFPACDGRYILIVDSVVADGSDGDTLNRIAHSVLSADPSGKEFTVPGQCDSLRKSVHGDDIYPIYLDFGGDKDAACRAKSTYGGNVRPLTSGSFPDASSADVDDARLALDPC